MKKIYSINAIPYGHFKNLEVIEEDFDKVNLKDMDEFIYFFSEEEAVEFLNNLKTFIRHNYVRAKQNHWYN